MLRLSLEEHWLHLCEAVRTPFSTSAIAPTGHRIIRNVGSLTPMGTKRVLEIGSGTGRLLRHLLATGRINDAGTLGAIEMNPRFVDFMERTVGRHPCVEIVQGRAEDLHYHHAEIYGKEHKVDRVYASLPFSIMKNTPEIFAAVDDILAEDGEFIVYIVNDLRQELSKFFDVLTVKRVHGNLFPPIPYVVHRARKVPKRTMINGFSRNGKYHQAVNGYLSS